MSTDDAIAKLNELLRGELSAVQTYDLAIESTDDLELGRSLTQLRYEHAQRVDTLGAKVRELAGQPCEGSGPWGAFAKAVQVGADVLGDTVAIAALEEGEDHGLRMYSDALSHPNRVVRDLVNTVLLPAQRKSHDVCRSLKRFLKAA